MSIFIRLAFAGLVGVLCFSSATAQTVVSSNLLLVDPGSGHMAKLQVPALTGPLTYNLPNSNGTLLITNGSGVSSGWLLGGNDLSSAGPSDNKLGTSTTQDLILIAGNDGRMQLSNATSNVTLLDGTKLSFEETGGSNVSSFVAGAQSDDINYTLPTAAPAAGQVLTATNVTGPSPFAVTLGWENAIVTPVFKETTTDAATVDQDAYVELTDLTTSVFANAIYEFEIVLGNQNTNGTQNADIALEFPSGTATFVFEQMKTIAFMDYTSPTYISGSGSPAAVTGVVTRTTLHNYRIRGILKVGATAGDLKLMYKMNSGENGTRNFVIKAGSYLVLRSF